MKITEAQGYRQEYRSFGVGYPGYHFRIIRIVDGVEMCSGPGTDPAHPPPVHPDWSAMPTERRRAIRSLLDGRSIGDGGEVRCGDLMRVGRRLCGDCASVIRLDDDSIQQQRPEGCGELLERWDSPGPGCEERAFDRAKREGVLAR